MPTYEYVCDACDHEFELFQQMSDPVKRKCPDCGKLKLRRLIGTGAAVLFKGSGFYETDYRSDSYKKARDAEKKGPDKSDAGKKDGASKAEKSPKPTASDSGSKSTKSSPPSKKKPSGDG